MGNYLLSPLTDWLLSLFGSQSSAMSMIYGVLMADAGGALILAAFLLYVTDNNIAEALKAVLRLFK